MNSKYGTRLPSASDFQSDLVNASRLTPDSSEAQSQPESFR